MIETLAEIGSKPEVAVGGISGAIGFLLSWLLKRSDVNATYISQLNQDVGLLKAAKERSHQADQEQRDWIDALDADLRILSERIARIEEREKSK